MPWRQINVLTNQQPGKWRHGTAISLCWLPWDDSNGLSDRRIFGPVPKGTWEGSCLNTPDKDVRGRPLDIQARSFLLRKIFYFTSMQRNNGQFYIFSLVYFPKRMRTPYYIYAAPAYAIEPGQLRSPSRTLQDNRWEIYNPEWVSILAFLQFYSSTVK